MRLGIDCQATVPIGEVSRGDLTRSDHEACDHDLGLQEKYIPGGIVDEDTGQLRLTFGSSDKTSDCIVNALEAWWSALDETEQVTGIIPSSTAGASWNCTGTGRSWWM